MKLKLSLALTFVVATAFAAPEPWKLRDGVPNAEYFAKLNRTGNQYIFCMSDRGETPWSAMTDTLRDVMKTHVGPQHFVIPEGAAFARYSCVNGQAVFGERVCSGYLALLDFSATGAAGDCVAEAVALESHIRAIYRYRCTHSIVLVHTVKSPWVAAVEKIADHYGIPSLDLTDIADKKVRSETAAAFTRALFTYLPVPEKAVARKLPPPLYPTVDDRPWILAYEKSLVKKTGAWKPGQAAPIRPFRHVLESAGADALLEVTLPKSSAGGFIDVAGADTPPIEYSVDGGVWQTVPAPKAGAAYTSRWTPCFEDLDRTVDHVLRLRPANGSGRIRLAGLTVNGDRVDDYRGLSPLARIDAVYAGMERPVTPTFAADRFQYLPNTMKKLREGGRLKMLWLGDSIIGCTLNSKIDLLLKRAFPSCELQTIASIRSSTGCRWYREENRVEEWVLAKNPDTVVIGGISNGKAEYVREVVRQLRARRPELEILLLTPVFGNIQMRDEWNAKWTEEIDFTTDNLRAGMAKVAQEEKCAFFDMTGPWGRYVRDAGVAPGWFWSDSVHANERGCQIIGRLLENWFTKP